MVVLAQTTTRTSSRWRGNSFMNPVSPTSEKNLKNALVENERTPQSPRSHRTKAFVRGLWVAFLLVTVLFGVTIFVDALLHVFVGHRWTIMVYHMFFMDVVGHWFGWEKCTLAEAAARSAVVGGHEYSLSHLVPTLGGDQLVYPFAPTIHNLWTFSQRPWTIRSHVLFGAVTFLCAAAQVAPGMRKTWPKLHRYCGRMYAVSFSITALMGGRIGELDWAGYTGQLVFYGMAATALITTWIGVYHAVKRDYAAHRVWMTRSLFVCFGVGIMLRVSYLVLIPVLSRFDPAANGTNPYVILNLMSYVLSLVSAEVYLRRGGSSL